MVKGKEKWWVVLGLLAFIIYIFTAARPISEETILKPRWITSLESNYPVNLGDFAASGNEEPGIAAVMLPFILGERFGYVDESGKFFINQIRSNNIALSERTWTEYEAEPNKIDIMNPHGEIILTIENNKGYPLLLDNRVFIVGIEQNSLTAIGPQGEMLWTHFFAAPLTCIDAGRGYVIAGTLDGALELLNSSGLPVFPPFEPGGSRLSVILGCAISADAMRLAIISGIDDQRFLLLERSGETFKVIYHEFLTSGFRRPVHINFVNRDSKVVFEREGGLGIYDISSRSSISVSLDGQIAAVDNSGEDKFLFVITSLGQKEMCLNTIRYPGIIVNKAPFSSGNAFFARRDNKLYLGGDLKMVSFEMEKN